MPLVDHAVECLRSYGIQVLSPSDPRVVDQFGDFVFVASDRQRTIRLVQDRHLAAIRSSDFLWLVAPDGYVGPSAAFEIGYATALGVPIFAASKPEASKIRPYVAAARSPLEAATRSTTRRTPAQSVSTALLLDTAPVAAKIRETLKEKLDWIITMGCKSPSGLLSPMTPATQRWTNARIASETAKRSGGHRNPRSHASAVEALIMDGSRQALEVIRSSGMLWLSESHERLGQMAEFEMGYATALGVPIFASSPPSDLMLRQYVGLAASFDQAAAEPSLNSAPTATGPSTVHVDHSIAVASVHKDLDVAERGLTNVDHIHLADAPETRAALFRLEQTLAHLRLRAADLIHR